MKLGIGSKFKCKFGLFECFNGQKILKYKTKLFSERFFFLGAFVVELLSLG